MTARDRLMLVGMLALAILVGGYLMVVSPERKKAAKIAAEVAAARQQLQSAEAQAAEATSARSRYGAAYTSLVSLGPAVPASGETPSLVYALAGATHSRHVEFTSIESGSGSAGAGGGTSGSGASSAPAGATFSQEPFSLIFNGSFSDLDQLLHQLEGFTDQTSSGSLRVSGRLLTIDGVQLKSSEPGSSNSKQGGLNATVTATAYVLPPGQSALGGASPAGPAGASPASGSSGSGPTTAAVVKAGP